MPSIIPDQRLRSQRLEGAPLNSAVEVADWLGAVQAQKFAGAKWALGLRMRGATEAMIDEAFNDGAILRTHVMRRPGILLCQKTSAGCWR